MAYNRGNLAVKKPEKRRRQQTQFRETTKKLTRKAALPMREKMLYLFTVVVCSAVAMFLIGRYAEIYELNRNIEAMKRDTEDLKKQASVLHVEKERLSDWDRIGSVASENGLTRPTTPEQINVYKEKVGNN
ncbi:cell division protein FtsL [Paenibacillus sp. 481]|uniref:cell division protein FtsL n=1 Tax=Paenibacillus sp. 481 TaxID=2835869 RepID=UPI001E39EE49|nr:cell division protein FtsL [Paenibacillus sp. 481]UHA74131.1 cell division protein FtsL [Paenibacillus sp. 481]